jgi:hypothetical protein
MTEPHGVPTTAELVEAVREFLEQDVMPAGDPRVRYLARVSANVLAQCERELALGPAQIRVQARLELGGLAALGLRDDREHLLARLFVHAGFAVEHARDGLDRHAGLSGHVDDGRRLRRTGAHGLGG